MENKTNYENSSNPDIRGGVSIVESGLIDDCINIFGFIRPTLMWLGRLDAKPRTEDEKTKIKKDVLDTLNVRLPEYGEYLQRQKFTAEQIDIILHSPASNSQNIQRFNEIVAEYNEASETNSVTPEFAEAILNRVVLLVRGQ